LSPSLIFFGAARPVFWAKMCRPSSFALKNHQKIIARPKNPKNYRPSLRAQKWVFSNIWWKSSKYETNIGNTENRNCLTYAKYPRNLSKIAQKFWLDTYSTVLLKKVVNVPCDEFWRFKHGGVAWSEFCFEIMFLRAEYNFGVVGVWQWDCFRNRGRISGVFDFELDFDFQFRGDRMFV